MKLYEFTYTDNQNLSEPELLRRVGEFLGQECELQGWGADYRFRSCRQVEHLASGEKNYFFEVIGKYLSSDSVGFDQEISETSLGGRSIAAAEPDLSP